MWPWLLAVVLALLGADRSFAQSESPVYVDDSPLAWEMFQRAYDQTKENAAESVRLYQELLDQFGTKLIPVAANERDRMFSVRARVLDALRSDPDLLSRYQLIELAEAQRMLSANQLTELIATRSLTTPGLEALLREAQRQLEAARFYAALRLLREASMHPNLDAPRAAHCAYMTALAAHYLGHAALRDMSRQQLVELGKPGAPFVEELDRLIAQPAVTSPVEGVTPFDEAPAFELDDLVAQEIWSRELPETLSRRRVATSSRGNSGGFGVMNRPRRSPDVVTVAATATDRAVFVNEGHCVRAFDRFTGFDLWPSPYRDRISVTIMDPDESDEIGDLNLIAVEGDSLVTLTGHAITDKRSSIGQILCLNASTGTRRWSTDLESLLSSEDYIGVFPYGKPIIAEGRVFCLARKQSQQMGLTATYLIALDLQDGSLAWIRHVASSAVIQRSRAFSTPVYDAGDILIDSPVGAVASVDASTGTFNWLRVHRPPVAELTIGRQSWESSGPVVTPRGIVALQPDDHRVMLLDRATGQMIESYPIGSMDGWGAPTYLLGDDRFVFAIGTDIRAFAIGDLSHPIWQIPSLASPAERGDGETSASASAGVGASVGVAVGAGVGVGANFELAGRVVLTRNVVVVPTLGGVVFADVERGRAASRLAVDGAVVPLAVDSELFVAGADSLAAYMPFGAAERILRARLAGSPDDIDPALSLLRLGMRVRHIDLVLEAAEMARVMVTKRSAGAQADSFRDMLFSMLLDAVHLDFAVGSGEGTGGEEGSEERGDGERGDGRSLVTRSSLLPISADQGPDMEKLHAMLRAVAVTPAQQIEQLLAYGAWLEHDRLREAVEAYQTILENPLLASAEREDGGVLKTARLWAIDRLSSMIAKHGRTVYAPQEDYAHMELSRLEAGGRGDVNDLRTLAARFPFADAAGEAGLRAAALLAEAKLPREALATLATVEHRVPAGMQPSGLRVLGAIVQLSVAMGWRDHAITMLRHAERVLPNQNVVVVDRTSGAETEREPAAWLETLGAKVKLAAKIGRQSGPALVLAGMLVPGQDAWLAGGGDRLVLVMQDDTLMALKAPDLTQGWSTKIGQRGTSWQFLGVRDGAAILWQGSPVQDPRAVAVSLTDGAVRWTTPSLDQVGRHGADQIRRDGGTTELMPNGMPLNPAEVLPILTETRLLLVRRTGEVFAVDLQLGEPILTVAQATLDEVHNALATDLGLVLIGRSAPQGAHAAGPERVPAVLVIDGATGEALLRIEPTGTTGVLWSGLTKLDELVYGTDAGVELVNLETGNRRWRQRLDPAQSSRRGWVADDRVLIEDSNGELRSIALETGAMTEPFQRPHSSYGGESAPLVDVIVDHGRVFAEYSDRIVRVAEDGTILGADAIADERDYQWLAPASDRLVLVSKVATQQVFGTNQPIRRTEHFYRMYALSENGALIDDGIDLGTPEKGLDEPIRSVTLMDGWMFVSTGSATLALPMPVSDRSH